MANVNRLIGCSAYDINKIVKRLDVVYRFQHPDYVKQIKEYEVNHLSNKIINQYSIKDCENIIISHTDFIDAILKLRDTQIDMTNKLVAARQIALPYVKSWISNKIQQKLFLLNAKRNKEEHCCCVCLEPITRVNDITITPCSHVFHNSCMRKWNRKTCPMCRSNL